MAHKEHEHCQNCGAHFATRAEHERHCLEVHHQPLVSTTSTAAVPAKPITPRKNKEFTRRHLE